MTITQMIVHGTEDIPILSIVKEDDSGPTLKDLTDGSFRSRQHQ